MSETDEAGKILNQINMLMPQVEMLNSAFQPLIEMFKEYLEKIGIRMDVGAVYLRKRGKLIYGIIFEGSEEALRAIMPYIGGERIGGKEKEETE